MFYPAGEPLGACEGYENVACWRVETKEIEGIEIEAGSWEKWRGRGRVKK